MFGILDGLGRVYAFLRGRLRWDFHITSFFGLQHSRNLEGLCTYLNNIFAVLALHSLSSALAVRLWGVAEMIG